MEGCAQGAYFLSRRNPDNVPLQGALSLLRALGRLRNLFYFSRKATFEVMQSEALPMRASKRPGSAVHCLVLSS